MNCLIVIFIILIILLIIYLAVYFYGKNNEPKFTDIKDGCLYKRYGCCNDNLTPKLDTWGSNCV